MHIVRTRLPSTFYEAYIQRLLLFFCSTLHQILFPIFQKHTNIPPPTASSKQKHYTLPQYSHFNNGMACSFICFIIINPIIKQKFQTYQKVENIEPFVEILFRLCGLIILNVHWASVRQFLYMCISSIVFFLYIQNILLKIKRRHYIVSLPPYRNLVV